MPWTNVQLLLNSRDATNIVPTNPVLPYNNLQFNAVNQNLVQGQIHSVSLNEMNFPYDIPNIQVRTTDNFEMYATPGDLPGDPTFTIVIAPGFYDGTELANAINTEMLAQGAAFVPPVVPGDIPVCTYDTVSRRFTFTLTTPTTPGLQWGFASAYTYPIAGVAGVQTNTLGKDIFSLMGYLSNQDNGFPSVLDGFPFVSAGSAPLSFTQYIDVCSPELCQYQYFRDGSTTNLARRADVICRLYISNNVATQEEEGVRPFVINRQFNNARVMRWNAGSSVGSMSIQLYDDVGQPLQTVWRPRPYQITFNVYEQDKDGTTY